MQPKSDVPFDEVAAFHGHVCPGLAMGYRMARCALQRLASIGAADEELVAVVENDACGVDALQYLAGCTFGKGNLLFADHGKQVYTLYERASGKAVRVTAADSEGMRTRGGASGEEREKWVEWLLQAPDEEVVRVEQVSMPAPEYARIRKSVTCAFCGEQVMETRARVRDNQVACIPCAGVVEDGKGG